VPAAVRTWLKYETIVFGPESKRLRPLVSATEWALGPTNIQCAVWPIFMMRRLGENPPSIEIT